MAEVLITLGIIGVVAALTMPSLINDIQDRQFKAMFKKQVSVIFQAISKITSEDDDIYIGNAPSDGVEYQQQMRINACKIMKEVKTVKSGIDCSTFQDNNTVLWHGNGNWYNKKKEPQRLNTAYQQKTFITVDGALINFNCWSEVFIDVNGYKGPNTIGRDIYYFILPVFGSGNAPIFYNPSPPPVAVNGCSGAYQFLITQENYEEDCKSGTGWGCSPKYILE